MSLIEPGRQAESPQKLRELRRGVAQAGDAQVLQVVRMVDKLEARGASDALIEPIRPRLRAIRLSHPLRLSRLLFMPCDRLIVASSVWRPGSPLVPRTALAPFSTCIRTAMLSDDQGREQLQVIEGLIANATTADAAQVRRAGALLWPMAERILRASAAGRSATALADCLASWTGAGLPAGEFTQLSLALCPILAQATRLHDHDHGGARLGPEALGEICALAAKNGARAAAMMLGLLLIRVPHHADALVAAAQSAGQPRAVTEQSVDAALGWIEAESAQQADAIGDASALELRRQAALLRALSETVGDTARRRRVAETNTHLLDGSLRRLKTALDDRLAAALQQAPVGEQAQSDATGEMEAAARTLRRFEIEARRLGGGRQWDSIVGRACQQVSGSVWLSPMDKARLVEILAGPEEALKTLTAR